MADRPLRIWQICESYPPKYGGGAAVRAKNMSQMLVEHGHEVRVLATESRAGDDYTIRTASDGPVTVENVNLRRLVDEDPDGWSLGLRAWRAHERRVEQLLDELLSAWLPDVVQYHMTRPLGEVAPLTIARRGVPLVAVLHDAWFVCTRQTLLRSPLAEPCGGPGPVRCLECMYSHYDGSHARATGKLTWRIPRLGAYPAYRLARRRSARRVLAGAIGFSQFMIDVHRTRIPGPALHLSLGIDLEGLPATQPRRPREPLRFGFFAGFQPHKGIWDLLDAAAALKRDQHEFELYIWGPPNSAASRELSDRGLENHVHLKGMYESRDMWSRYCEVDVAIVATTVCEPFGLVPLEARAVGAPTIAPAIGGLPESIRDGIDGLLYRFRDAGDLERQMRRIMTEPGLFERLCSQLPPVTDARTRSQLLDDAYTGILDHPSSRPTR